MSLLPTLWRNIDLWFADPPLSYSIAGGATLANQTVLVAGNVSISAPYNPATASDVVIHVGNLTDLTLMAPVDIRFVNLTVTGSFSGDGRGGTVSEFALV